MHPAAIFSGRNAVLPLHRTRAQRRARDADDNARGGCDDHTTDSDDERGNCKYMKSYFAPLCHPFPLCDEAVISVYCFRGIGLVVE